MLKCIIFKNIVSAYVCNRDTLVLLVWQLCTCMLVCMQKPCTVRICMSDVSVLSLTAWPCTAGAEEWNPMIQAMIISCAGLVQYLVDEYPSDLPHYDPL